MQFENKYETTEEIKKISCAWAEYVITHRLNPGSLRTYRRAQADFLAGVLACYAALETEAPVELVLALATGKDFANVLPITEDE